MLVIFLFIFNTFTYAKSEKPLTAFQSEIKNCDLKINSLDKIKTFKQLYSAIDKQYILLSEKTVTREVFFSKKADDFKIKVDNDKITLYEVGDEGKVTPITYDARQKVSTTKGKVKQLILNTKVDEDWGQYFEQREMGLQIQYSIRDGKISQMTLRQAKNKQVLECKIKNDVEVCNCQ